jgi:hypothetical protein
MYNTILTKVKGFLFPKEAKTPRDGDKDGFVNDGKANQAPAPAPVKKAAAKKAPAKKAPVKRKPE